MRIFNIFLMLGLAFLSACSRQDPLFIGGNNDAPAYLEVIPAVAEINVGTSQSFTAYRIDPTAQTREDVSASVQWSSTNTSVASVNSTGTASGATAGSSVIKAQLNGLAAFADLTVSDETLSSMQVFPVESAALVGMDRTFTAIALFANGRTQDVTNDANWTSDNTTVANIIGKGQVSSDSQGTANVTATLGGVNGGAKLAVLNATVDAFSVSPPVASIQTQTSETFSAYMLLSSGETIDVTEQVTWSSTDGKIATVSNQSGSKGVASGLNAGTAQVVASASFANITLADAAELTVTAPALQSLEVTPADVSVPAGTTGSLVATAYYSDNSARDVTRDAYWNSSNSDVVFVESTGTQAGFGQALTPGNATVTARFGGLSEATAINVSSATLQSIQISPALASIAAGTTTQYFATGIYSDRSSQDITSLVNWETSNSGIASIDSEGLAYGVAPGTTEIRANYQGIQSKAELTVTNATINSIEVSPTVHRMQVGSTQSYRATALMSDGERYDITRLSYWKSNDSDVVVIDRAGRAIALSAGTALISASFRGLTDTGLAVVTDTTLQSLLVIPDDLDLQEGTQQAYSAIAFYTDHVEDVTALADWRSSDTRLATVSNQEGSRGLVQTILAGQVSISASYEGKTDRAQLSIYSPTLTAIEVICDDAVIHVANQTRCEAIASYSDGHKQNISSEALWRSGAPAIATVENFGAGLVAGRVTGITAGTAEISANLDGISGSASVRVQNAVLNSITVSNEHTTLSVGDIEQFYAEGNYSDGSTSDLTRTVVWASNDANVLSVSNALEQQGLASAESAGTTTLTASQDGVTGTSATITVQVLPADNVRKLNLLCLNGEFSGPIEIEVGEKDRCKAYATLTDNTVKDVTASASWTVKDPSKLRIVGLDNNNEYLEVEGLVKGTTQLKAEYFKKALIVFKVR